MLSVCGTVFGAILPALLSSGAGAFALLPVLLVLFVAGVITLVIVGIVRGGGGSIRWYRLDRFARANGMTFTPALPAPPLPGMIFQRGSSRQASDLVRGAQPRFVEFANYRFTPGSGQNRTTPRWGFVAESEERRGGKKSV